MIISQLQPEKATEKKKVQGQVQPYSQRLDMEFDRDSFKSSDSGSNTQRDNKSPFTGHNSNKNKNKKVQRISISDL